MSVDNYVHLSGKVIKGPKPLENSTGTPKARYQIEIRKGIKEKELPNRPFVVSYGKQAQRDLENLKPGDYIEASGKLITHFIQTTRYFKRKEEDSSELVEVNVDDLADDDDSELFETLDEGMKTEVQASNVKYWSDILAELTEKEFSAAFGPKMLMKALDLREEKKRKEEEENK